MGLDNDKEALRYFGDLDMIGSTVHFEDGHMKPDGDGVPTITTEQDLTEKVSAKTMCGKELDEREVILGRVKTEWICQDCIEEAERREVRLKTYVKE